MYKYSAFSPACILLFFPILYLICTPCRCIMNLSLLRCNDLFSVLPLRNGELLLEVSYCIRFFF